MCDGNGPSPPLVRMRYFSIGAALYFLVTPAEAVEPQDLIDGYGPAAIRRLIAADDWVQDLKRLRLVATCIERDAVDGAAELRRELKKKYPDKPATFENFPELARERRGRKELVFDERRFALSWRTPSDRAHDKPGTGYQCVWNGETLIECHSGSRQDWVGKAAKPDIKRELISQHFPWLRLWPHPFWFASGPPPHQFYGDPNEYRMGARLRSRARCRVYEWTHEHWNLSSAFRRIYIRASDRRVIAWQEGKYVHSPGSELEAAQLAAFCALGEDLVDIDDAWLWWFHVLSRSSAGIQAATDQRDRTAMGSTSPTPTQAFLGRRLS